MIDKLIDFSLQNRLLIVMFAIMVMIAGYRAYTQLPIDAFPDVSKKSKCMSPIQWKSR